MIAFFILFLFFSLLLFAALVTFIKEKEWRALNVTIATLCFTVAFSVLILYLNQPFLYRLFTLLSFLLALLLFLPIKSKKSHQNLNENYRHDERDIMFSRNELVKGTEQFEAYYKANPQNLKPDNEFREEPGLLTKNSLYFHSLAFNVAQKHFKEIKLYHSEIDKNSSANKVKIDSFEMSQELKELALEMGALDLGITELKDYHVYSHKGRGDEYGQKINPVHKYAIAFTVEMDYEMVQAAPKASIVLESSKQYLNSAQIAIKLAEHIRNLGYEARAHIDGNYQLICPLLAKDAGLGEIGRMGLLMTHTHGPRARIAVVTTNIPLKTTLVKKDKSVEQFCYFCKKCAVCCPSQSIPHKAPEMHQGSLKWKINSESCFTYWCKIGTDCGRCMAVCPYSHPNTPLHRFSRWAIKNNYLFLRLAVVLDDLLYGRKPKSKRLPKI